MGCKNLQTLNVEGKIPPCYNEKSNDYKGLFYNNDWDDKDGYYDNIRYNYKSSYYSKVTLHVPAGCKEIYSKSEPWNHFENIIDDL
jgi:nitrate reductase beta subunit